MNTHQDTFLVYVTKYEKLASWQTKLLIATARRWDAPGISSSDSSAEKAGRALSSGEASDVLRHQSGNFGRYSFGSDVYQQAISRL